MNAGQWDSGDVSGALGAYASAPAVMLAFEGCDAEHLVLASANDAARAAFGDLCEYGRRAHEMAPGVDRGTHDLVNAMVGTAVSTGRSVTRPAHRVRVEETGSEASEVFWDLTISPWYDEDGSMRGVLAHGVDVTERTRARRQVPDPLHDVVSMQDALLPEWLPVLPGLEVAGRYLMAHHEADAGGDWYDAMVVPGGRVALVVGDVPGHGVAAAAAMGRLRAVAEERLTSGDGLGTTMRALDSFARDSSEARAATLCVTLLDPGTGRLEYCTAGHPPPLVVRPNGRQARYLARSGAAPLATSGELAIAVDRLARGDLLVLYTNGLLARPDRTPAVSTVELGQAACDAAEHRVGPGLVSLADQVCGETLEAMTLRTGYDDDIALLVASLGEPGAPLHLELDAGDDAMGRVLDSLATWMEPMHVRDLDHIVVQQAVDELVANVVEHAYPDDVAPGRLSVDAALLSTGEIELRVVDRGHWIRPTQGPVPRRGLAMVRGMVDSLEVEGSDLGTTVTVRHRLSRPAHMLTGAPTALSAASAVGEPFRMVQDDDCLQLLGALDRPGAGHLRSTLHDLAVTDRVVLDLSGLTRLPSVAVQVLHAACRDATDRGQELVLFAPAGTTAQHVLELVGLPYALTM
jgi:anti-sigma regulatory factor (Ser/Thr protein kinase)/anti-anti-sigma regulatory factor